MVSRFRVSAYICPAIIFTRFIKTRDAVRAQPTSSHPHRAPAQESGPAIIFTRLPSISFPIILSDLQTKRRKKKK